MIATLLMQRHSLARRKTIASFINSGYDLFSAEPFRQLLIKSFGTIGYQSVFSGFHMQIHKNITVVLVLLACSVLFKASAQQPATPRQAAKEAKKWYKKRTWMMDVPLKPHKTVNEMEFYRQYHLNKTYWDKAFAFLQTQNLHTIAKGKYPIDGDNVFASVTIDSSKDFEKTTWESHRKYIDVQCIIEGVEKMGVVAVADATITKPYDEKRDAANYSATGKIYTGHAGSFFIFFPADAHRPNISPGGNKPVRKIVIKVKAAI